MKRIKYLHWIELDGKHYITIGRKAPWNNKVWIRLPAFICKIIG